ncbi:MAG: hypothetical protein HY716_15385 [Planctomycetes bacterium]|nr:hypothetical protein [Planctomycetota bacterium]
MKRSSADLEATLIEMGRHPLLDLADELSGEAEERMREEGDSGPFIERLAEFLQGKNHALIGGLGVRAYVRQRPTLDFDVMIDPKHWTEMRRFLVREGADSAGSVEDTYLFRFERFKLGLDVRLARSPLDQDALRNTEARPFKRWKLRIVKPNHLAAMKVKAFSERKGSPQGDQDRQDVLRLIETGKASRQGVRAVLKKHRPDLLAEFESFFA